MIKRVFSSHTQFASVTIRGNVLIFLLLLAGCVSGRTIDGAPPSAVDLVETEKRFASQGEVLLEGVDRTKLADSIEDFLNENGFVVSNRNLSPFIISGVRKKDFSTTEKIAKGLVSAVLSGGGSDEDYVTYKASFILSPAPNGKARLSARLQKIVRDEGGRVTRGRKGVINEQALLEIVSNAES